MAQYERQTVSSRVGTTAAIDEGLRNHMLRVYNYMGLGLGITGVIAFFVARFAETSPAFAQTIYGSPLAFVIMLSPLAFVFALSFGINRMSAATAQMVFWGFAAVMGLSLSSIFLVYTDASIAKVFFITAAMFGAMSLWGYTTKRDLTAMGSFLFMGLIGLIVASIVNIFLGSSMLEFAISVLGVLIFTGLTAYDTQKIKEMYFEGDGAETAGKKAIMGALALYLDFINLFLMLLRLFGNRE
ncbi:Bax inhibitor-1/YccA family protein [Cucumibacter marinus]|uniref:Bax inhibitor-1/YccA family protein n=1 Tax=Cucumibacter marinus TaxID=1121252 RepID=UPI00040534BC|nr:Bax inhibitor-1/YccA family protein [Cucumibacter marinus]